MIIRIFETAIEPTDVERAVDLFRTQVKPAFAAFDGCEGIDMHLGIDEHSGDLVEVCAISHWDAPESIKAATERPEYDEALKELRELFREAPIIRHYETVE